MEDNFQPSNSKRKRQRKKSSKDNTRRTKKKKKKKESKQIEHDEKKKLFKKFCRYMESSRIEKMGKYHSKFLDRGWEDYFLHQINEPFGSSNKTFLHQEAAKGNIAVIKFLIYKAGVDTYILDKQGNNFIHCALNFILESLDRTFLYFIIDEIFGELSDASMSQSNKYGETAFDMFDEIARLLQTQQLLIEPESESDDDKEMNDREWNERIFAEMAADDYRHHNNDMFHEDEHRDTYRKTKRETFEEWGNRMSAEYRHKHTTKPEHTKPNKQNCGEQPSEPKKRKLGPVNNLKAVRYNFEILQQREQYENACSNVFANNKDGTVLKFDALPWKYFPGFTNISTSIDKIDEKILLNGMIELFSHGFTDQDKIRYLKVQRIRWHPDKFLQKCGQRLEENDSSEILELVKSISQEINSEIAKIS